jgi:hypothetical protein
MEVAQNRVQRFGPIGIETLTYNTVTCRWYTCTNAVRHNTMASSQFLSLSCCGYPLASYVAFSVFGRGKLPPDMGRVAVNMLNKQLHITHVLGVGCEAVLFTVTSFPRFIECPLTTYIFYVGTDQQSESI